MMRTVTLFEFMPYGAPELQSVARPYMVRALLVSMALTTLLFASAGLLQNVARTAAAPPPTVTILLPSPPVPAPIGVTPPAAAVTPPASRRVVAGVPLPTADERVAVDQTIASADELRVAQPGLGTGDAPLAIEPAAAETLPQSIQYNPPVDEMPVVVRRVEPEYPSLAREAAVSGTVLVLLLVGKDGKVLDAKVEEHHSIVMLDEAAVAAARQWTFTPAYTDKHPVAVWVAVPFNFRLQ
jgi:protein TonB